MRRIDFISQGPQLSIFKEDANKTNLGGFLYLVYIIVLILLAIIYLFDYFSNEKYEFDYTLVKGMLDEEIDDEDMKSALNYDLDCFFVLGKDGPDMRTNNISNNDNFVLVDVSLLSKELGSKDRDQNGYTVINKNVYIEDYIIKQGDNNIYTKNTGDFALGVLYRCNGSDCNIREEDKINITSYYLYMAYKGLKLDHQNPDKPIQPLPKSTYWLETVQFLENTNIVYLYWQAIKYEEEKGIFGKTYDNIMGNTNTYYAGNIKSRETFTDDGHMKNLPNKMGIIDKNGNHFIMLLYLDIFSKTNEYERYSRKEIFFLDVLADVSALASTVLDLMALAYGFLYSQNYDNYKIVENILTKKMKMSLNNRKIEEDIDDKKIECSLIDDKTEVNENIINSENTGEEKQRKKISSENLDLPTPRFVDFLCHKLYSECFGPSSRHALIESCNDLVAKYITIESILYNQMRLEYLWKDYKWNNPQYEAKQKDDLIFDLSVK